MAQVQLRDQQGRPIPGIAVRLAFRGDPTDKALFEQIADGGGNTDFGYAAAGIIAVNANAHPDQLWTLHVNKNQAFNPNWQVIEQKAVDVPGTGVTAFQQDVRITLQASGDTSPIHGDGTCAEWKNAVFAIFAKHGYTTNGPENAGQGQNQAPYQRATIAEIKALHPSPYVQWQYTSSGNPLELRPRLFLPNPGGQFDRYADMGDWNGPLKWDHCV